MKIISVVCRTSYYRYVDKRYNESESSEEEGVEHGD